MKQAIIILLLSFLQPLLAREAYALFSENGKFVVEFFPKYEKDSTAGNGVVYRAKDFELKEKLWSFDWYGPSQHVTVLNSGKGVILVDSVELGRVHISTPDTTCRYEFSKLWRKRRAFKPRKIRFKYWMAHYTEQPVGFNADSTELIAILADQTLLRFNTTTGELLEKVIDPTALTKIESITKASELWQEFINSERAQAIDSIIDISNFNISGTAQDIKLHGRAPFRVNPKINLELDLGLVCIPEPGITISPLGKEQTLLDPEYLKDFYTYYSELIASLKSSFKIQKEQDILYRIQFQEFNTSRYMEYDILHTKWRKITIHQRGTFYHNRVSGITICHTMIPATKSKSHQYIAIKSDTTGILDTLYHKLPDSWRAPTPNLELSKEYKQIHLPLLPNRVSKNEIVNLLGQPDSVITHPPSDFSYDIDTYFFYKNSYISLVTFSKNVLLSTKGKIREKYFQPKSE